MKKPGSGGRSKRVSNGLVALGSAAVLAVYTAGYARTRPAAARFALEDQRRPTSRANVPSAPELAPARPAVIVPEPPERASSAPKRRR